MNAIRRPFSVFAAAVCVTSFGLLSPSSASGQSCTSSAASADQSSQGTVRFQAVTTQSNCSGRTAFAEAWVEGLNVLCLSGGGGPERCTGQNGSGNASVTVAQSTCGSWSGRSNHFVSDGGTVTNIQLNRATSLHGGTCGPTSPDCSPLGPDYYWNGFECTNVASPIVIAPRPSSYRFTSWNDGVLFDIDGDGDLDQTAWTEAGSDAAFLARDIDGDGLITSGKELFGDHTFPVLKNGFEALAFAAQQSNGWIMGRGSVTEDDPLFFELLLWTDSNHNGISEQSELRNASAVLSAIGVGYQVSQREDGHGNMFMYRGWAHVRTARGRNPATSSQEDRNRRVVIWDIGFTRQP